MLDYNCADMSSIESITQKHTVLHFRALCFLQPQLSLNCIINPAWFIHFHCKTSFLSHRSLLFYRGCSGPSAGSLSSWKPSPACKVLSHSSSTEPLYEYEEAEQRIDRFELLTRGTARADLDQLSPAVTTQQHLQAQFLSPNLTDSATSGKDG